MRIRSSWLGFFRSMTAHPLGYVGVLTVSTTSVLFTIFFALSIQGAFQGPYKGIFTFLILPGIFFLGLLLIPLGRYLRSRSERKGIVVDFSQREQQSRLILFLFLTGANVAILFLATYHGIHFTDSNTFCGQVCHAVMQPEYTAYAGSPHSRVACVSCHIGSGADFFVRYKINGLSQVLAVLLDTYERPIPTPVHNLRPARETCEQCHWPEQFHGDKLLVKTHYEENEENTPLKTVLVLKVGGGGAESGYSTGIHWHTDPGNKVYYAAAGDRREKIVWVEVERSSGERAVYTKDGEDVPDSLITERRRLLDCMDCHNRPTHTFERPDQAIDNAFTAGRIDMDLPSLKSIGLELLTAEYPSKKEALKTIPREFDRSYREKYPEVYHARAASIRIAGEELAEIYRRNIFPAMRITWSTYPNHIGHRDEGGCFRCHAGDHRTAGGDEISSDCETCHTILAWDEEDPEILHAISDE